MCRRGERRGGRRRPAAGQCRAAVRTGRRPPVARVRRRSRGVKGIGFCPISAHLSCASSMATAASRAAHSRPAPPDASRRRHAPAAVATRSEGTRDASSSRPPTPVSEAPVSQSSSTGGSRPARRVRAVAACCSTSTSLGASSSAVQAAEGLCSTARVTLSSSGKRRASVLPEPVCATSSRSYRAASKRFTHQAIIEGGLATRASPRMAGRSASHCMALGSSTESRARTAFASAGRTKSRHLMSRPRLPRGRLSGCAARLFSSIGR